MKFELVLVELMDYIESKNSHGKNELQSEIRRLLMQEAIRVKEGK